VPPAVPAANGAGAGVEGQTMTEPTSPQERAIILMRAALVMLEQADHAQAMLHLHSAIDAAKRPPFIATDGDDPNTLWPMDRPLTRAIGGAFAILGTLLQRQEVCSVDELADVFKVFAVVTSERDDREGIYLACWANVLRELAEARLDQRPD
jgi:hypothetical protein